MVERTLYRYLLLLYPATYRCEFGEEMRLVFQEAKEDEKQQGSIARVSFFCRETGGMLAGALREHVRELTGHDYISFRRFNMRREYRFPKSTAFFMCASLAVVIIAIIRGTQIEISNGIPANFLVWPSLLWTVIAMLLVGSVVVGIVLAVLAGMQRSGSHRLENLQSWTEH
jgi:hypothetical protein